MNPQTTAGKNPRDPASDSSLPAADKTIEGERHRSGGASRHRAEAAAQIAHWLSPRKIGAIYLWLAIVVLFGLLEPELFLRASTVKTVANSYAISGLAALAVLIPLVTGSFDVSVGGTMSLVSVVVATLLDGTALPIVAIVAIGLCVGAAIGLVNSLVIVVLRIPSLIGTLAMLGVIEALAVALSGNSTIAGPRISGSFSELFAQASTLGLARPVLFLLTLMVVLGLLLEQTQPGRFMYATGFNAGTARLSGLRVPLIKSASLVTGSCLAGFAGIVLTARLSSSTPAIGSSYLLPAFAAVFLGATQFRVRRFNSWGVVVAVFMLGTGQYGLVLLGAPSWSGDVFQGIALIAAVAVTQLGDRQAGMSVDAGAM